MAQAPRDHNYVPTMLGVSTEDGATPTLVEVDAERGGILVEEVGGFFSLPFDKVVITYTDGTKATIATVKSYYNSELQQTLTYTSDTDTDTYEVS